jgi:hypothetical protein
MPAHGAARLLTRTTNQAIQEIETHELRADLGLARDRFFCASASRVNPTSDPGNRAGFFLRACSQSTLGPRPKQAPASANLERRVQ